MMKLRKLLRKLLRFFSSLVPSSSSLLLFYPESYYCLKCRKRVIVYENAIVIKNPRARVYGICPLCGSRLTKYISRRKALALILLY